MKKSINITFLAKKVLCLVLILSFTTQASFAIQNYRHTTTTSENYSAASPVGRFENSTSNGVIVPGYTPYPAAIPYYPNVAYTPNYTIQDEYTAENHDFTQPEIQIAYTAPYVNYGVPTYNAGVAYANPNFSQNKNIQDITTPQSYNKTVSTTEEFVDTRERADKIIDRGAKVIGSLALLGAVTGLIIGITK